MNKKPAHNKGSNAILAEVELIEIKNIKLSYKRSADKSSTALSHKRWQTFNMNRITLLIIMISFFGLGKSNAQKTESEEQNKGIIGKYYENDFPVIMKFVNELPDGKTISRLPYLTIISWKYDGCNNDGMPTNKVNDRMLTLEEALVNSMKSSAIFKHAYSRTGNNLKELVYYTTNQNDFITMLNRTLENQKKYPIEIDFIEDIEWNEFKKVLKDFKNK